MKKVLITATALMALLIAAPAAHAEPENPIVRGSMDVQVIGGGKVTGSGIDCGTDCSDTAAWRENEMPPKNRLTATPGTGWGFHSWTNCTPVPAQANRCDASYSEIDSNTVTARFIDVQAPSVFISYASPGEKAGDVVLVGAESSDNDRVTKVEFLIGGSVMATDEQAPWSAELDTSGLDEGTHQLSVRSFDPAGNQGITANWPLLVDHTAPELTLNSPLTATNAASPQFSFSSTSADFHRAECAIQKQGETDEMTPCGRDEWYSEAAPTEGTWEFLVRATDDVENTAEIRHTFIVDRTAPTATFTSGPADGSVVEVGNVTYRWNATDGLPLTQTCTWDNGEATPCTGSATRGLTAGAHSFKVEIADTAGNTTVLSRTVNVKKDGDTPPPDPTDKTAPVVKLVVPKQKLRALGNNLRINVRCNEACAGQVVVTGKPGIRFTGRVSRAGAGVSKLKLRPTAKVRKRLVKLGIRGRRLRALNFSAKANLKDRAGNVGKANRKFKVKA